MTVVDPEFAEILKRLGAKNVTVCFNCGNCTAICPLSSNKYMFPRKIIRYIQLGLKDKILESPEIWMCHACGECSVTCPRQAYPSEIMNASRNFAMKEFAFPKFMAKLFESPKYLPIIFSIPLILLYGFFSFIGFPEIPSGNVVFSKFIHHKAIESAGLTAGAYVILVTLASIWKFNKKLNLNLSLSNILSGTLLLLKHEKFKFCEENFFRYYAHAFVFYGFILIGISAIGTLIYLNFLHIDLPLPLWDPVKIIGNIGAIILITGLVWIIYERIVKKDSVGSLSYNDAFFISTLLLVALTGVILEALRLAQSIAAYPMYLLHLIFVFCLLVYSPYSKFAHIIYRAFIYISYETKRNRKV